MLLTVKYYSNTAEAFHVWRPKKFEVIHLHCLSFQEKQDAKLCLRSDRKSHKGSQAA